MLRPAHTHPCATAQQPNLVPQKTRLITSALVLFQWLLSLILFSNSYFSLMIFTS